MHRLSPTPWMNSRRAPLIPLVAEEERQEIGQAASRQCSAEVELRFRRGPFVFVTPDDEGRHRSRLGAEAC